MNSQRTNRPHATTSSSTPAFRKVLACASALGVLCLVLNLGGTLPLAGALALSAAILVYTQATRLLLAFVALMPVGLFVTGVMGAVFG